MSARTSGLAKVPIELGSPSAPLFGWYHPPRGGARRGHGAVLCNPVGDDLVRAHRPLRHLAERLAALGMPVLRFDYRGTGDSAGDEAEPARVPGWLEDVDTAIDELRARSGVERVFLIGLRLGATLAAAAAERRQDVEGVVLWSPYPSGRAYVADVTRTHQLHRKLEPGAFSGGPARAGGQEALGFFLTDETIAALAELQVGVRPARRVLVVGAGLPDIEAERAEIPPDKFLIVPPHVGQLPEEALGAITGWLDRHATIADAAAVAPRLPSTRLPGEEPLVIDDRLFGILARPAQPRPGAPAVVMLNAGCVPRFGPHRQYAPLARRWAELGFHVLRLDLAGIGDSPGHPENLTYPASRLEDLGAALRRLEQESGASRFVLLGLCSGADVAFDAALADRRVVGAVMLNPRTFCVHDLDAVESYKGARWYQGSLKSSRSWLKLLRGQVNVWRVARALAPRAVALVKRRVIRLWRRGVDDNVPARLRSLANRGVEVLLVVAHNDPGIDFVDSNHGVAMRALNVLPHFRRHDLSGTDHTFTALWAQQHVGELVTRHLLEHHLPVAALAKAG
jgi:alpha-beta hydrolase superfamily lysophospholipase